jgi:hypothetical protein
MGESAQDLDRRMEELSREAAASIRKARASGHSLYLQAFDVSAVRAAYGCAPAEWDRLLEGAGEQTADFVKRVRSAESLYMALCEALLEIAPDKGALLWAALPAVMRTKMKGAADISEFVHMVFRVPDSPEVERLRETLTSFAATSTDLAIQNLVIAAQCNGRDDWLDKLIQQDRASSYNWRRQRGIMLDAFRSYSDPGALEWPSGWKTTSFGRLESSMVNWRIRGALSRLWWSKFVKATDTCSAFAAWHVFLACVDRRAWAWMEREMARASTGSDLDRLRALHVQMNRDQLESKFSSREEKIDGLGKQLFGHEAPAHWLEMDAIAG